ncbi:MAG: hypothetical protein MUF84_04655 [Anaerolineae bacterium]|nr:hypothetical protein [Anaerolineae bacterium]
MGSQTTARHQADGCQARGNAPAQGTYLGVLLLSAATLMFEIALTRLFSVAQFYHFAFMVVSLAMLGFGASGTWLALRAPVGGSVADSAAPGVTRVAQGAGGHAAGLALGCGLTAVGAYLIVNWVPFDSYSIAWDWRQALLLSVQYLVLSFPFFLSGSVLSLLLARHLASVGPIYAVNLAGSAVGCVLALLLPALVGAEGVVWLSGMLSGCAALLLVSGAGPPTKDDLACDRARHSTWSHPIVALSLPFVLCCAVVAIVSPAELALRLSPYKGLSYALQVPGSVLLSTDWNGYSRVDLVASSAIRSLPGLSYRYPGSPPSQLGVFVDGDDMSPVVQAAPGAASGSDGVGDSGAPPGFAGYLPSAVAYALRPEARSLVIAPGGGLEVWVALNQGARHVTVAEPNSLIVEAVGSLYEDDSDADGLLPLPDVAAERRVTVFLDDPRSYVRRAVLSRQTQALGHPTGAPYDIVVLALTAPFRPIRSGAYSLGEDYRYTTEAFVDYLSVLNSDGLLVVSRWVQAPPSESLRVFALAVEAIERLGGNAQERIVAFRGYAMMTLLVSPTPFSAVDLASFRRFAADRAFDMVYAPDIRASEVNRYNVLPSPIYYDAFRELIEAVDREAWYAAYPFDVRPPTDDHPFFGHYFKWSQTGQIVAELGKTWQPFGGAGYFVLVALLMLAVAAATLLIALPMAIARRARVEPDASISRRLHRRRDRIGTRQMACDQLFFGLLGVGFLFVEIPLMQRAILFLGHPAYAVTVVLFALLLFSGIGSHRSGRMALPLELAIGVLVGLVLVTAALLPAVCTALLWLPWSGRAAATVLLLGPVGFFMGIPFPEGLRALERGAIGGTSRQFAQGAVASAWAANGALSVVASILSALLALSIGFSWVMILGALSYAGAAVIAARRRPHQYRG